MRKRITHEVKSWPPFFDEIIAGRKTHDLRRANDRDFAIGDRLMHLEWDPDTLQYTGRTALSEITYITNQEVPCAYSGIALDPDFCILSISLVTQESENEAIGGQPEDA